MSNDLNHLSFRNRQFNIGERMVGGGCNCFIIAEAGVNHNGDMDLAHKLIKAAFDSGADAIKFQAFVAEQLVTRDTPKANYQIRTTGTDDGQMGMLKALELSSEQHGQIKKHCDELGIIYICTPYERTSAEMLDLLDVAAYKVASTDTTNIPFLQYLASKNRPIILSTGMCDEGEVADAMKTLSSVKEKTAILHCTSEYPAPPDEANLLVISELAYKFDCVVGYSDHSAGIGVSPYAVAAGATIIEKHFTIDRKLIGPDHEASINPKELKELVFLVREIEGMLGDGVKRPTPSEIQNKSKMQKSIVAERDMAVGQVIEAQDLTVKRPGTGLSPKLFHQVIGQTAAVDISRDSVLKDSDIVWNEKEE